MAIASTGDDDGQDKKKKKKKEGKTRGRQKIEIKKIQKKSNLHVTFSKRRNGLMKKASEISVLCGAEVALIALSPEEKKAFAFGHPDLESVLARHTNQSLSVNSRHKSKQAATASIEKLKGEYEESLQKLQEEKKKADNREEELKKKGSENTVAGGFWWEDPIDDMGLEELEDYKKALLQLRRNAACRFNHCYGDSYTVEQ